MQQRSKTEKRNNMAQREYYTPPPPLNKPEKTMKLRFIGETFYYGFDGLTNGKIYEAWVEDDDYYRVIDDSGEDYLYPKKNPHATDGSTTSGRWEIGKE